MTLGRFELRRRLGQRVGLRSSDRSPACEDQGGRAYEDASCSASLKPPGCGWSRRRCACSRPGSSLRLHRLAGAVVPRGLDLDGVCPGGQVHGERPRPERIAPEILTELGRYPALAIIGGDLDRLDAGAAVEGDAAQVGLAGFHLGALRKVGHERAHVEASDRHRARRRLSGLGTGAGIVRDAIGGFHPEPLERLVEDGDRVEVLDPVGAIETRYHEAQRVAVEPGQVLAVHGKRQHHLAIVGVIDRQRLGEVRGLRHHRSVESFERDLHRTGLHAGLLQHGFERHARPAGVAHGAVGELPAGHPRLEEPAGIAGALIDGDDLCLRHRLEFGERERQRLVDMTLDLDAEGIRVDLGGNVGEMVAHEERIVLGDHALVEHRKRCFELRRAGGHLQQRALAGIGNERALAVAEGEVHLARERHERPVERQGARAQQDIASQHVFRSLPFL